MLFPKESKAFSRLVKTTLLAVVASPVLLADFTYESTSRITGGAVVNMMKFAGAFSKDVRKAMDPISSTTSIAGNRMITKTGDMATIIDLDHETITHVDHTKRTYSVTTFADMKRAMDEMSQKMGQSKTDGNTEMQFDLKMKDTGGTRTINGADTHEVILTMTMQGADTKSGAKGGIDVVTDMWIARNVAGYDEVRAFYRRMSGKLAWAPNMNPLINRPDMQRAMAELYKQGSKMDGMPLLETIKMGGNLQGIPDSSAGPAQPARSAEPASVSEAVGAALGGRLGLGGFGRRKKEPAPEASSSPAPSSGNGTNSASGSLMEMTREVNSYSASPANPALFDVPSGFTQVQEDPTRPNRRGR